MSGDSKKIRVLIVDDSFFMRKLLRELLISDADIEVVGEARNGEEAIIKAGNLKPNVLTMDYKMPNLDGAVAAEMILKEVSPPPAIIMLSAYTKEGAEETLKSLRAGAVDFILKPSGEISWDIEKIKGEILEKVRVAAHAKVRKFPELKTEVKEIAPARSAFEAVVIGASTGGPPVLEDILTGLPPIFKFAVLVAQHMPKEFTKSFADRLNNISSFPVKEAEDGEIIKQGVCLVAPGGRHMKISLDEHQKARVKLTKIEEGVHNGLHPSIDVLMQSAAEAYKGNVIGVLLSGMGEDGVEGMRSIKSAHGHTIVQDPETAVVDSMPQKAIGEGLADEVLHPNNISKRLSGLIK